MKIRETPFNHDHPLALPSARSALVQITNQLDVRSFSQFVRTCWVIYTICVNTDAIQATVSKDWWWDVFPCYCDDRRNTINRRLFDVHICNIRFMNINVTREKLKCISTFIERKNVTSVGNFTFLRKVEVPFKELMDFIKTVKPSRIKVRSNVLPEGIIKWMLTNLNEFSYDCPVSLNLALRSPAVSLELYNTPLTEKSFRTILKEWICGDRNFDILIFVSFDVNGLDEMFTEYNCFDVDYKGNITKDRPVVFTLVEPCDPDQLPEPCDTRYYIIRDDQQVLHVHQTGGHIYFYVNHHKKWVPEAVMVHAKSP